MCGRPGQTQSQSESDTESASARTSNCVGLSPPHQIRAVAFPVVAGMSKCESATKTLSPWMRTVPRRSRKCAGGSFSSVLMCARRIICPALSGYAMRTHGASMFRFFQRRVRLSPSFVTRTSGHGRASATFTALSRRAPLSESSGAHGSVSCTVPECSSTESAVM